MENETGIQFRELHSAKRAAHCFFVVNYKKYVFLQDEDVSHVHFESISNGCQFSLNEWGSIKTFEMIFVDRHGDMVVQISRLILYDFHSSNVNCVLTMG